LAVAYGATDVGPVRSSNEDNFLIDEALGLAMVADGMGGHAAGEVASEVVLSALRDYLREHGADLHAGHPGTEILTADPDATWSDLAMRAVSVLHDAIDYANQQVYAQNLARNCPEGGMGSTLTGFWRPSADSPLAFFHVGDSRLYRQRGGQIEQLTRDQTMYQQALDAGVIENLPPRNLLLQAMGPARDVVPAVHSQLMQAGDVLMLCSDGLHGSVPHGEMESVLATVTEATLAAACARLIELAKQYGGRDNITVLLALCLG
jgi:protein phosphatase